MMTVMIVKMLLLSAGANIKHLVFYSHDMFRMLGYPHGRPTIQSHFGNVHHTFAMDNVQCVGDETSLLDCPHVTVDDCSGSEGAGVVCSGDRLHKHKTTCPLPNFQLTWA